MRNGGRALRREQILESVWGRGSDAKPRVVDTYVKILRRKLGPLGTRIDTLRGVGYRLSGAAGRGAGLVPDRETSVSASAGPGSPRSQAKS
jgi:DNA-binding winged helix-turn-helix (wHTH) protein